MKLTEAYGISCSCEDVVSQDLPWEGRVMLLAGEEKELVELAESIQAKITDRPYKPCLRMMLSPVERVWK